jgi:hypothetical protein
MEVVQRRQREQECDVHGQVYRANIYANAKRNFIENKKKNIQDMHVKRNDLWQ